MIREYLKRGFESQKFEGLNERLVEYKFLFNSLYNSAINLQTIPNKSKKILDVGAGTSPLPAILRLCGYEVTAIDNIKDYWKETFINNHYYVIDDDITDTKLTEKFDVITCISTLEHIEDYMSAIKNMWELLEFGGSLILTFPYNRKEFIPNVYDLKECSIHPKDFICRVFSDKEIQEMNKNRFKTHETERWRCFSGKYWRHGERYEKPQHEPLVGEVDLICLWWKK